MIRSFRSKALRRFAERGDAARLSVQNVDRVRRIIVRLDTAIVPGDLDLPGFFFHPLKSLGRYSVRVTGNWRITFAWEGKDATDVDLEDYH
jgi:proteic killer suppression protein